MINLKRARQGAVLPSHKGRTAHAAIEPFAYEGVYVYPVNTHIGAPAEPTVAVGDTVHAGQCIADAKGKISARIHTAVEGTVEAIESLPTVSGPATCVVIRATAKPLVRPELDLDAELPDAETIRSRVQAAGIVGMGGAMFPTAVKLSPPDGKRLDTFIINGAECEPFVTADLRVMLEDTARMIDGAQIVRALFPDVRRVWLAIEREHAREIRSIVPQLEAAGIELKVLPGMYPQGAEKTLIKNVVGREVPPGGLPADVHTLVHNVATLVAISEAVRSEHPLVSRVVTVAGDGVQTPKNLRVTLGTPIRAVLAACGAKLDGTRVLSGGPMMGRKVSDLDAPIHKGSNGVGVLIERKAKETTPCIHCGSCLNVCPVKLQPILIARLSEQARMDDAVEMGAMDCIECGACSYICPAGIELLDRIRDVRGDVKARDRAEADQKKKEGNS